MRDEDNYWVLEQLRRRKYEQERAAKKEAAIDGITAVIFIIGLSTIIGCMLSGLYMLGS